MLHHANVDHFLAIWQVLNYDKWMEPSTAEDGGTWTLKKHQPIDSKTRKLHCYNNYGVSNTDLRLTFSSDAILEGSSRQLLGLGWSSYD